MIEKMRFLSITGPKDDFDRVVNNYLTKYDIHLENALTELSTSYNLKPFVENNPYKDLSAKSEDLVKRLEQQDVSAKELMSASEATSIINQAYDTLSDLNVKKRELKAQRQECNELHFRLSIFAISITISTK